MSRCPMMQQSAKEIFWKALEIKEISKRDDFLASACGNDKQLRGRVERLLAAQARSDSFLAPLVITETAAELATRQVTTLSGNLVNETIGHYTLREQIGEGGMGIVYVAEQSQPVRRKVALKVIKPGLSTKEIVARFEAERQALALMDHPNIARVVDGGATESGQPYFVMELVQGLPLTNYCDEKRLNTTERLKLFTKICRAVQHAHQKGVIHRDLKPANVLVAEIDGEAVPKVIDFGVAKAVSQKLSEKTVYTHFSQMVGTPMYMSPEQVGLGVIDIDTRSDVYSLGVMLYELLTGTKPFDSETLRRSSFDEMRRIIREQEPARPSRQVSTLKAEMISTVAELRRCDPRKLSSMLRGDLDWIVMQALDKDRNQRYETTIALAIDIERYLADKPVHAFPPSLRYRLHKFIRRNKGRVAAAGVLVVAVSVATGGVGWALSDRASKQAEVERLRTEQQTRLTAKAEVFLDEIEQLISEQEWPQALATAEQTQAVLEGGEVEEVVQQRASELLKGLKLIAELEQIRSNKMLRGEFFNHAVTDRDYAQAFRSFGVDIEGLPVQVSIDRLKAHSAFALAFATALDDWGASRRLASLDHGDDWKRLIDVARGIDTDPLRDRLRFICTQDMTPELQASLRELADSKDVQLQPPSTLVSLARTLNRAKLGDSAYQVLSRAQIRHPADFWLNFELARRLDERKEDEGAVRFYTAALSIRPHSVAAWNNLGNALSHLGRTDESTACYRKAIEINPDNESFYLNLGHSLAEQNRLDEAVKWHTKAIETNPKYARAYFHLGGVLMRQEKLDDAIAAYRQAVDADPRHANAWNSLGLALNEKGLTDEAIACYRRAIDSEPNFAIAYNNLGFTLSEQNRHAEAVACYRKVVEFQPQWDIAHHCLGRNLLFLGEVEESIPCFQTFVSLRPESADAHFSLGLALLDNGDTEEALRSLDKAAKLDPKNEHYRSHLAWYLATAADPQLRDSALALEHAHAAVQLHPSANNWSNLGVAYFSDGNWERAVQCLERADGMLMHGDQVHRFFLAIALWQLGNHSRARECYEKGVEWMQQNMPDDSDLLRYRVEAEQLMGIESPATNQPSVSDPKSKTNQ